LPREASGFRVYSVVDHLKPWQELYEENTLTDAKRAGDSVALVVPAVINDSTGVKKSWCCSGVLVSPDVMLTNWHCGGTRAAGMNDEAYWSSAICESTVADLGWTKKTASHQFSCSKILAKDKRLDFALMRIKPVVGSGGSAGRPIPARRAPEDVVDQMPAFIVHHSECAEKRVSLSCSIKSASYASWQPDEAGSYSNSDFTHDCSTERGASGSPVFDMKGRLIGLHHLGVKRNPITCAREDDENKAVRFKEIVNFLKKTQPELAAELSFE
jgi:hypothetical protein